MDDTEEARPFIGPRPTPSVNDNRNGNDNNHHPASTGGGQAEGIETGTWSAERVSRRLYVSHFLSTCNSRVFEFGAVLYLATISPGTLLPMSVYAVARGLSAVFLSSLVGSYVDNADRLRVVRTSIVGQRIAVAVSCALFYALARGLVPSGKWETGCLAAVTALACVEKLCSIMNMVSVERDWVVTITESDQSILRVMNSQMRRIDLVCKLLGPFLIAMIDGVSTEIAILVNFGMNIASVPLEYYFIAQIYHRVPVLKRSQRAQPNNEDEEDSPRPSRLRNLHQKVLSGMARLGRDSKLYFKHQAFIPSFACALLYLTVLSFSGQMVTYLLSSGYTSSQVAVARTVSVGFEVLATWIGPWLMGRIGPVRAGLWFVSWQSGCLLGGMAVFWRLKQDDSVLSASALVAGTILSRLGLWGFDLCTQIIIQEDVEEEKRGAFSATESAWQSTFEMCSYMSTIVLSRPDQFSYPASGSVLAVVGAWALYTRFVVERRGHLIHWPSCVAAPEKMAESRERLLGSPERRSLYGV